MTRSALAALALAALGAGSLAALGPLGRTGRPAARQADQGDDVAYDGRYTLARIKYTLGPGARLQFEPDGRALPEWAHDYPRAERHLAKILSELTSIEPVLDASNIFTSDDPRLAEFPIVYFCEAGYWNPTDAEVVGMRNYLLKGGFVIFDDFRGRDWTNFERQIGRVLPQARLIELTAEDPIFHSFFDIDTLAFDAPYNRRFRPVFYGIYRDNDPKKALLAIVNYNNDVSEYWEWSDQGLLPIDLSNEAYKLGINYIIYAMTH